MREEKKKMKGKLAMSLLTMMVLSTYVSSQTSTDTFQEPIFNALSVQPTKLYGSDSGRDDGFGSSVAISETTAVVGAPYARVGSHYAQGAAYVFTLTHSGWQQQAKLVARNGKDYDEFGLSVSISGDTVVVGAPHTDVTGKTNMGAAYVFLRRGTTWSQQAEITCAGSADDYFGYAVGVNGNTAIIGAPGTDIPNSVTGGTYFNSDQGAAYVYTRGGSSWYQETVLFEARKDPYHGSYNNFGAAVSISGSKIVVGVPGDDLVSQNDHMGSVRVYNKSHPYEGGTRVVASSDGSYISSFGWSVSIDGTRLVVGSSYLIRVFELRADASWRQTVEFGRGSFGDGFGESVSVDGNIIAVGAPYSDHNNRLDAGSLFVYELIGKSWVQSKMEASDGLAGDHFGSSVAVSGKTVIVCADSDDTGAKSNQGSCYIFP